MFKKINPSNGSPEHLDKENGLTCVIVDGTVIEGKMTTSENLRLDGKVIGEVNCVKRMVMGETGNVHGNTKASDLVAKGKITGDVFVKNIIHLLGNALVKGTIHAKKLLVEEGAHYDGECKIG